VSIKTFEVQIRIKREGNYTARTEKVMVQAQHSARVKDLVEAQYGKGSFMHIIREVKS
jgi:hypothetical protein